MNRLAKRLGALEASQSVSATGRIDLNALTDAELNQLEAIVMKQESGLTFEDLSSDELRFISSLPVIS